MQNYGPFGGSHCIKVVTWCTHYITTCTHEIYWFHANWSHIVDAFGTFTLAHTHTRCRSARSLLCFNVNSANNEMHLAKCAHNGLLLREQRAIQQQPQQQKHSAMCLSHYVPISLIQTRHASLAQKPFLPAFCACCCHFLRNEMLSPKIDRWKSICCWRNKRERKGSGSCMWNVPMSSVHCKQKFYWTLIKSRPHRIIKQNIQKSPFQNE